MQVEHNTKNNMMQMISSATPTRISIEILLVYKEVHKYMFFLANSLKHFA